MTCVRKTTPRGVLRGVEGVRESISVYRGARHFVYIVRGGPCECQRGARGSSSAPCARIGKSGHPVDIEPLNVADHEEGNEQCPHHHWGDWLNLATLATTNLVIPRSAEFGKGCYDIVEMLQRPENITVPPKPSTVVGSWGNGHLVNIADLPAQGSSKMSCIGVNNTQNTRSPVSPGCSYLQKRRRSTNQTTLPFQNARQQD